MRRRPEWRLKKTLSRKLSFRPIEDEDIRYAWAAYKKGLLASMGPVFENQTMNSAEFTEAFQSEILTNYSGAWTLFAENRGAFRPVGFVLAFYSHPNPRLAPFMIVGDMIWLPGSTARNKIESAVNFFNMIRREIPMVEYAREESKRFFETIMQHGIMRRIGTTYNVYPGEATAVYETRSPTWRSEH